MQKSNKKILITGGAGYIGQNLVNCFLDDKYKIYVIDNFSTSAFINKKIKKKVSFYKIDLTEEKKVKTFFKNKKNNYALLRYFNVVGSIVDFKIKKKVNALFDIVFNNIKNKKYKININGRNFNTKDGTPERDFIHISDLCKIHKKVYKYLNTNKKIILNCGSGERHSVLSVIREFEKKIKRKFIISYNITNSDETKTICADISLLRNLFKMNIEKKKLSDLIKDYE